MFGKTKILIAVSGYNESASALHLSRSLKSFAELTSFDCHIALYDDGSIDNTGKHWEEAFQLLAQSIPVTINKSAENLGLSKRVGEMAKHALQNSFDLFLKIDADGQMDCSVILRALESKDWAGSDIYSVPCNPHRTHPAILRDIRLFSLVARRLCGLPVTDILSDYRLYSPRAMETLVHLAPKIDCYGLGIRILEDRSLVFRECQEGGTIYECIRPFPVDGAREIRRELLALGNDHLLGRSEQAFWKLVLGVHLRHNCLFNPDINGMGNRGMHRSPYGAHA